MIKIIGALLLLLFLIEYIRNLKPQITRITVESGRLGEAFDGLTMVVLADLHNYSYGKNNEVLIKQIDSIKPDFILIAGDMLVRKAPKKYDTAYGLLKALSRKYPIYYGMGNHEQSLSCEKEEYAVLYKDYADKLIKDGIVLLDNESTVIKRKNNTIKISGLSIEKPYYGKSKIPKMPADYIENLLGQRDDECYNILIAHNPMYFENYAAYGVDLILAGHVHGGIIRLPFLGGMLSPQYRFFPKYDAGRFSEKGSTMLISRGLGLHTLKFRIGNRPELMTVILKRK